MQFCDGKRTNLFYGWASIMVCRMVSVVLTICVMINDFIFFLHYYLLIHVSKVFLSVCSGFLQLSVIQTWLKCTSLDSSKCRNSCFFNATWTYIKAEPINAQEIRTRYMLIINKFCYCCNDAICCYNGLDFNWCHTYSKNANIVSGTTLQLLA